jgi:Lrp/AsnC family transcriptional regulator, regulator for asnA, asnC and gidA
MVAERLPHPPDIGGNGLQEQHQPRHRSSSFFSSGTPSRTSTDTTTTTITLPELRLDTIDLKLMDLLMSGYTARQSAQKLGKPVSTIQRRARLLVERGALKPTYELGYSKLGIKKGFLHVYMEDGNVSDTADNILKRDGMFSVGVHLGNSDIVGFFVFRDSREVLDLIAWAKDLDGVDKVVWSEEVYSMYSSPNLPSVYFRNKGGYNSNRDSGYRKRKNIENAGRK